MPNGILFWFEHLQCVSFDAYFFCRSKSFSTAENVFSLKFCKCQVKMYNFGGLKAPGYAGGYLLSLCIDFLRYLLYNLIIQIKICGVVYENTIFNRRDNGSGQNNSKSTIKKGFDYVSYFF